MFSPKPKEERTVKKSTNWSDKLLVAAQAKKPLPVKFYERQTLVVARELIGKLFYFKNSKVECLAEIQEVEAYLGLQDAASHSFRGLTKRNWPMFEAGGTCYVYLSYGSNYCMNVSTQSKGSGEAVLFRALRPLVGHHHFQKNRKTNLREWDLLSGPGKICQAFGIDLSFNGHRFLENNFKIIEAPKDFPRAEVGLSARIGISKAADLPYRFFAKGSPWLSRKSG